jgi:hypothetical protein
MLVLGLGPLNNPEAVLSPLQGLLVALAIGLGIVVKARTSRLTVTAERIERCGGLLDRRCLSLPLRDLAGVRLVAGLTQRLLGVGSLHFESRSGAPTIRFWGVENPRKVKAEIERLAGLGGVRK